MLIQQDNLAIRNATVEDASTLGKWWRDGKVMAHAGMPNGLSISDGEIAVGLSKETDETSRRLIIELYNKPIGEMSCHNKGNGIAEIGIKICDFSEQEKGYGTKLYKMLMNYLFKDLCYNTIITSTNTKNLRAQHVYENKIGFHKVGIDENTWIDQLGQCQSYINYSITKEEFSNINPTV
jgi:RimJ/RimL family protein N-acetyltransferase